MPYYILSNANTQSLFLKWLLILDAQKIYNGECLSSCQQNIQVWANKNKKRGFSEKQPYQKNFLEDYNLKLFLFCHFSLILSNTLKSLLQK